MLQLWNAVFANYDQNKMHHSVSGGISTCTHAWQCMNLTSTTSNRRTPREEARRLSLFRGTQAGRVEDTSRHYHQRQSSVSHTTIIINSQPRIFTIGSYISEALLGQNLSDCLLCDDKKDNWKEKRLFIIIIEDFFSTTTAVYIDHSFHATSYVHPH